MSAVTAIYHIVINTHCREMTLPLASSNQLYRYIARVVQNSQSTLFAINGNLLKTNTANTCSMLE